MKIIYEGDSFVQSILGSKQLAADTEYRPSSFVMCHEVDGKRCLYNNFRDNRKRQRSAPIGEGFLFGSGR